MSEMNHNDDLPTPAENATEIIASITEERIISGPIPEPEILRKYEEACPGISNRMITMAERQQESRLRKEENETQDIVEYNKRNQIFGFLLTTLFIVLSFSLLNSGNIPAGGLFGLFGVAGILRSFLGQRRTK